MDDSRTVPSVSIPEAEKFWDESGRRAYPPASQISTAELLATGIDMPGIGNVPATAPGQAYVPGQVPEPLRTCVGGVHVFVSPADVAEMRQLEKADNTRDRLLIKLMYAARRLAIGQLEYRPRRIDGDGLKKPALICWHCKAEQKPDAPPVHKAFCLAGEILEILSALEATVPAADAQADGCGTLTEGGAR